MAQDQGGSACTEAFNQHLERFLPQEVNTESRFYGLKAMGGKQTWLPKLSWDRSGITPLGSGRSADTLKKLNLTPSFGWKSIFLHLAGDDCLTTEHGPAGTTRGGGFVQVPVANSHHSWKFGCSGKSWGWKAELVCKHRCDTSRPHTFLPLSPGN